jgi:hypothetical protein
MWGTEIQTSFTFHTLACNKICSPTKQAWEAKDGLKYPRKHAVTLFLTFSEEEEEEEYETTLLTHYLAGPVGYRRWQKAVCR